MLELACIDYEALNKLDIQSIKNSNNLLGRHDEIQSQCQSNLHLFNSDSFFTYLLTPAAPIEA